MLIFFFFFFLQNIAIWMVLNSSLLSHYIADESYEISTIDVR